MVNSGDSNVILPVLLVVSKSCDWITISKVLFVPSEPEPKATVANEILSSLILKLPSEV